MTVLTESRQIRITVLVDNEAGAGLEAEHGFSLWIDTGDRHILFDTGQGERLLANAAALNIDLAQADSVILSHGHYDHSGGLGPLLHHCHSFELYCHPASVNPRYSVRNHKAKSLQMPRQSMAALDRFPQERLHWVQQPLVLSPGIGLTGPILRETSFEDTGGPYFLDQAGHRPDPVDDDLALWISTDSGLIVCVGCAHSGLINTLKQVLRQNPGQSIRAVIGGFHLLDADRRRMELTTQALRKMAPEWIIPCHCTGEEAVEQLRHAFGRHCRPGMAGMKLSFETQRT
ncbi:MAG: MBL fold metallo-hydrolase [Desulfobulbus sp.]|nr:MBL fold metallo-hydrolase [Desulfobulbus sp.]